MSICSIEGCGKKRVAHGFCAMHRRRFKTHGDPLYVRKKKICKFDGCVRKAVGFEYCSLHYKRFKNHGSPSVVTIEQHRMEDSTEYNTWMGMKARCGNKNNHKWTRYGARGIFVCDEWKKSFLCFYRDMGNRPHGMQLDRIDNDGPYSKENCRWVTPAINSRNSSTCRFKEQEIIYIRLSPKTNTEIAKEFGCQRQTIGNIRKYRTWKDIIP